MKALNMPENKFVVPKTCDISDKLLPIVRSLVGAIPVAGTGVNELINYFFKPSLTKRTEKRLNDIGNILEELQYKVKSLESLISNENFIDVSIKATQIALSTCSIETHKALKNCIINSVILTTIDEQKQKIFVSLLENFTEYHILFLKLFNDPEKYIKENYININNGFQIVMSSLFLIIKKSFPKLEQEEDFCSLIWDDLFTKHLFNTNDFRATMYFNDLLLSRTTALGKEFIKFITKN
jgi:hypothetical protein